MARTIGIINLRNITIMKKQLLMFATGIMLVACTENKDLEAVKQFANDFASKVRNNQVDSIRALYPDAVLCDSFALKFVADDIDVKKTDKDDKYIIHLGEGISFTVKKDEEGNMNITESHGLFAYPNETMDIARGVGIWEDELTDAQFAERVNDNDFKDFLSEKAMSDFTQKIEAKEVSYTWATDKSIDKVFVTLKNLSDFDLKKSDYKIKSYWQYNNGNHEDAYVNSVDLKAGENKKVEVGLDYFPYITEAEIKSGKCKLSITCDVILTISRDEILKNYYKPTGGEYLEYFNNKKQNKTIF